MDPLDDLLESMDEAAPHGDAEEAKAVLKDTADRLTASWEDTAATKARIRDLQQLLNIFLKAGKTLRLYHDGHHYFEGFIQEFITRLYIQFEAMDALTFEVTPHSINWDGYVIFSNPEQRENMAFKLYRDGVRLLQFRRGANAMEVRDFVELMTRDVERGTNTGNDLSVLFWEADFKSIQIAVAETFVDYSEEAARVLHNIQEELNTLQRSFRVEEGEWDSNKDYQPVAFRGLDLNAQSLSEDEDDPRRSGDLDGDTALRIYQAGGDSGGEGELVEATAAKPYKPALPLEIFDDLAMQKVYDDLQGIDNPFATFEDVGVVLATVIFEEEQASALEQLLEHLDDALSPLLASASLGPLNSILRRLSLLEQQGNLHKPFRSEQLQAFFDGLCKTERLRLLAQAINTGWSDELRGELFTFVSLQKRASFDELLRFLGQLEPLAPRRIVVDALLLLCGQQAQYFAPLTDDGNARLTCDALYALGRLADPLTVNRICSAIERPEPMVREAVLNTLREFQSPRIQRLMLDSLNDPADNVRLASLRYLTVFRVKDAVAPISEVIRSRAFAGREFDEKRGWYIALGHIAGESALPALRRLADPGRGQRDIDDAVHLALLGIKSVRSPKARKYLENYAGSCEGDLQLLTHKLLAGRRGGAS